MATPATVNPFNHYVGLDGLPLENGYIWFGEPFQDPELVPLAAYWDDANTQPAAQPIRTTAGYPARNGAPAMVFVGAQYSMRVRDRNGRQVFYAPNVTAVDLGGGGLDVITASGGQTIVTLVNAAYTPGANALDVYLNGIRLVSGQDYFETGTNQITMAAALSAGDQVIAFARSTFGLTQAVLSDWQAQVFNGAGGASQNFVLTRSPGAVANLDVSVTIGGIGSTLRPLIDYTLSGNTVTITPAPAVGTNNVLIRYGRSLPQDALRGDLASTASAADGSGMIGSVHTPGYIATTLYAKLRRDLVYLDDFVIAGDADYYAASRRASIYCATTGATLRMRPIDYVGARIEVHKTFNIEGGGAKISFLGVGSTYAHGSGTGSASVPVPWTPTINDPDGMTDLYPVTMFTLSSAANINDNTIALTSAVGLEANDYIFIGAIPSTASSPSNWIPQVFEFAKVKSIAGNTVTLYGKLINAYTTAQAGVFQCDGLAVNCTISDLRVGNLTDAYQHVIRSSYNVTLRNIEFTGDSAMGACTFSENLLWQNIKSMCSFGPLSTARGTVSATLDGYDWQPRTTTPLPEAVALFIEESFYRITCTNMCIAAGGVSVRSLDMSLGGGKRLLTISDSLIDARNVVSGVASPFQNGSAVGADITVSNCTLAGTVVTPDPTTSYPGITGQALTWQSANGTNDVIRFQGVHFISTNAGPVFPVAISGFGGSCLFDDMCTYETVSPPITQWTPRGNWRDMASTLTGGYTVTASSVALYRLQDKTVYMKGRINLNGAAAGSTFFTMPAGFRPQTEAKWILANDANTFAIVRCNTSGNLFYVNSGAAITYLQLDQISFPIDV